MNLIEKMEITEVETIDIYDAGSRTTIIEDSMTGAIKRKIMLPM